MNASTPVVGVLKFSWGQWAFGFGDSVEMLDLGKQFAFFEVEELAVRPANNMFGHGADG